MKTEELSPEVKECLQYLLPKGSTIKDYEIVSKKFSDTLFGMIDEQLKFQKDIMKSKTPAYDAACSISDSLHRVINSLNNVVDKLNDHIEKFVKGR
jgi:hypothetical protein